MSTTEDENLKALEPETDSKLEETKSPDVDEAASDAAKESETPETSTPAVKDEKAEAKPAAEKVEEAKKEPEPKKAEASVTRRANMAKETRVNKPATSATKTKRAVGIRRVKMTISRVDPWSALKISFLVSVAIGIMIVVAAVVLWLLLDAMHVWSGINDVLVTLNNEQLLKVGQLLEFGRVIPFSVVVAVIEIVLMTALGTVMALIFNVISMLVGGMHITVTDE